MTVITRGRRRLLLLVVAIVALVGAGVAYGTIPGSDGVIHSCYNSAGSNPSGLLRVIDTATD